MSQWIESDLQSDEARHVPSQKLLTPFRIAFVGLFGAAILGNIVTPFLLDHFRLATPPTSWNASSLVVGFINGMLIGEPFLIAFWFLLDRSRLPSRFLNTLCLGFFTGISLVGGLQVWPGMPVAAACVIIASAVLLPFFVVMVLRLVAWMSRNTLCEPVAPAPRNSGGSQFGLGYLLLATFFIALAMASLRAAMPKSQDGWLTAAEFLILVCWFAWLAFATSLFVWIHFLTWRTFSLAKVSIAIIISVLGPNLFQWVSSQMLFGRMGFRFRWFDPRAYSMSFGLIFASMVLAGLVYIFRDAESKDPGCAALGNTDDPSSSDC